MHYLIKKFWNVVSVIVLLTMSVAAVSKAATVTSANDYPTTLRAGASANHTLVFTTPSGAAGGDTITVTFDAAFDGASVTEDDIDLKDDGVDLTTAADCSGAEQASFAMLGDVATFEVCAGDGGDIAPGSVVTIMIGTNATASGTGANRIANPSSAGTFYLSIAGTFGDSGTIALPMLDAGSVTVTAGVTGGGTGGGGGGGECGDTTAPTVSSVLVSGVTASEATITWSTDENASSAVDYGTTASYEIGPESDSSLVTSHTVSLSGLTGGETYHIRVRSSDLCGNQGMSSDQTFTTSDDTAPVISDIVAEADSTTSVTITWTTDEPTTSTVNYGTSDTYGDTVTEETLATEHSVTITGLTAGTTYHFEIVSEDASGNVATSADDTVTTDSAVVTNVSNVDVTNGDGMVTLSWTNPSDATFDGVRILMCTSGYPSDESDADCEVVYDGSGTTKTVSGLTNGTTYYFGLFAYDIDGQFASGALATGTPSATEEEVPTPEDVPPVATPPEGGTPIPAEPVPSDPDVPAPTEPIDTTVPPDESDVLPDEVPAGDTTDESQPEIPPTSVSGDQRVPDGDVSFFVANRQIQLVPTSSGVVRMLSSRPLRVSLLTTHIVKPVSRVQFVLADGAYLMAASDDGSSYVADVSSPGSAGTSVTAVSIYYADGTAQSISYSSDVVADGYVYATVDGQTHAVGGASVTLLQNGTTAWDGSPFGQFNPFTTGADAQYGWYVPNTTYVLTAAASGYSTATSTTFSVTDHIVNRVLSLDTLPAEVAPPSSPIASVSEAIAAAQTVAETIRSNPGVQATAAASTPALAVATSVATVALAASFDLLPFLQYVFSAPFLFFWRRKRRAFGIVYNAISKAPVDLATVRLYRMPDDWQGEAGVTGRLVQSRVTDKGGRHYFLVEPGRYRLTAFKSGFDFPSDVLSGVKDDGDYLDVYHGEPISVNEKDVTVAVNVPLDPTQAAEYHTPAALARRALLRKIQGTVAMLGILLSIVFAVIRPTVFSVSMVGVQVLFYLLVRRLATPRKPKSWGIVYDQSTGKPLAHAIARVFEPKYNKLLETVVTDGKGRYSFLLGPNEYYTAYQKPGYESQEIRPIDFRAHSEPSEFSADVRLKPATTGPSSPTSSGTTSESSDSAPTAPV